MRNVMKIVTASIFALCALVSFGDVTVMASRAYVNARTTLHPVTNNGEVVGYNVGIQTNIVLATTNGVSVVLPEKWALANVTNDAGGAVSAADVTALPDNFTQLTNNANFKSAVEKVSPPVVLPSKWALANVTNNAGGTVTAPDVGALETSYNGRTIGWDNDGCVYLNGNGFVSSGYVITRYFQLGHNGPEEEYVELTGGSSGTIAVTDDITNALAAATNALQAAKRDKTDFIAGDWVFSGSAFTGHTLKAEWLKFDLIWGLYIDGELSNYYDNGDPNSSSLHFRNMESPYEYIDLYATRDTIAKTSALTNAAHEVAVAATNYTDSATNALAAIIPVVSSTDTSFTNAVLQTFADNIGTNAIAVLNEIGDLPITPGQTGASIAGLLAALAAAIAWLKKKKIDKLTCSGVADITTENGTANLSTLFSSDNTSLVATIDNAAGTGSGTSIQLETRKTKTLDWSTQTTASTACNISFAAGSGLRYCELLLTGVTAANIDIVIDTTTYTLKSADSTALTPETGDNLLIFAEYATNCFIVSRQLLSTVS